MRNPVALVVAGAMALAVAIAPLAASALPPDEMAAIAACEAGSQGRPEQFDVIKRYSTGGWAAVFGLEKRIPLFCGENVPGDTRHGYLHIKGEHQLQWETVRTRMVDVVGPHPALTSWIDVVDPAIKALLTGPSELTDEKTECRTGVAVALNSAGGSYYRGYRVIVQRRIDGGVYPEDAVGTAHPIDKDCYGQPIVINAKAGSARASAAVPQVRLLCDAKACSYTVNADNAIVKPGTDAAYFVGGPLKRKWESSRTTLPAPTTDTSCKLVNSGCSVTFSGSSIYYTSSTGAQIVAGRIRTKWSQLGAQNSWMKYPTTSEKCGLVRSGCFSHFQGGSSTSVPGSSIHYSPATGAWATRGKIREAWIQTSSERGHWGYPKADEYHPSGRPASHRQQDFEYGFFYFDGTSVTGEWGDPGCPSCRKQTVHFPI